MCAAFAVILFAGGRRRLPHLCLVAFLLLLAGNQGAEALRALAADDAGRTLWFRVATVFAALDPLALYYFASVYPERNALNRPVRVGAVVAACGGLAFAAVTLSIPSDGLDEVVRRSLELVTGALYAVVLLRARQGLRGGDAGGRLVWLAMGAALVFALARTAVTAGTLVGVGLLGLPWASTDPVAIAGMNGAAVVLVCGLLLATGKRPRIPGEGTGVALGAAVAILIQVPVHLDAATALLGAGGPPSPLIWLGRSGASVRWLLFGGFLSMALLRHDLLGLSVAHRRASARVLVALAFIGAGIAALSLAGGFAGTFLTPLEALLLVGAVAASQRFRGLIDAVCERVYGIPREGDMARALEAYRASAAAAAREGRALEGDPELARLREDLGLEPRVAQVVHGMVAPGPEGPLVAGRRVGGRYALVRLRGKGGSGRVFLARDELLGRDVALKEVVDAEGDATSLAQEAALARDIRHPNVLPILDVNPRPDGAFVVTEYLAGGSLAGRLEQRGPLPQAEGLALLDGILAGLEEVHRRGIVHRDVKPSNVLLAGDGTPKLADFGLARHRRGVTARFDEPDAVEGTPAYMAPEQLAGLRATPATDVHAAGLILARCVQGPLPAGIQAVADRALEADPARRWPDARAMRAALRDARQGLTPGT